MNANPQKSHSRHGRISTRHLGLKRLFTLLTDHESHAITWHPRDSLRIWKETWSRLGIGKKRERR